MIVLAAIEGNLIFLIVAAAVGAINWWMEKKKKASQGAPPEPPSSAHRPVAGAGSGSEEQERLRRFLEALGVPQAQQPTDPQPPPQAPRPHPSHVPRPRAVPQTRERPMQTPRPQLKPVPRAVRPPKAPVVFEPEEFAEAGRLEGPASSIERISGEFQAMNVRVDMPSMQMPKTSANAGTTSVTEREGNPLVASLRRTLTNPTEIRAAFLAAELLGPPRGLQNSGGIPNLRSS